MPRDATEVARRLLVLTCTLNEALANGEDEAVPDLLAAREAAIDDLTTLPVNPEARGLLDQCQAEETALLAWLELEKSRLVGGMREMHDTRRRVRAYGRELANPSMDAAG